MRRQPNTKPLQEQEVKDLLGRTIAYICTCGHVYWKPSGECPCKSIGDANE